LNALPVAIVANEIFWCLFQGNASVIYRNLELRALHFCDGHVFAFSHVARNCAFASSSVAAVPCVTAPEVLGGCDGDHKMSDLRCGGESVHRRDASAASGYLHAAAEWSVPLGWRRS
jgi:hypothetical protein